MSDTPARSEAEKWAEILPRRPIRSTPAERFAWVACGVAGVGFLLTLLILLTDRADYVGPPVVTLFCMSLALTAVIASGAVGIVLVGVRQIMSQYRDAN